MTVARVEPHPVEASVDLLLQCRTPMRTLAHECWDSLCFALSTHPSLRQLDLSGSVLNERAMKTLCMSLRQPTCKVQSLM